jgi:membrane-bound lytic murein transglycosylase A
MPILSQEKILEAIKEIIDPLKESCNWWLETHQEHPSLSKKQMKNWNAFCQEIVGAQKPNDVFHLMERYLIPYEGLPPFFQSQTIGNEVFCTGYYEPTLKGSLKRSEHYSVPLYKLPDDKKFTRRKIRSGALENKNLELLWVADEVKAFFLEIQGSGRIVLENGSVTRLGYAGQNGYPYTAIGKVMFEKGYLSKENLNLKGIQTFLYHNPNKIDEILNENASYVFFKTQDGDANHGPIGTQGLPLTPYHSVAADPSYWPFGMIAFIQLKQHNLHKVVLTQDTGGAIKGPLRFDLFCGWDERSEEIAGSLQSKGSILSFWPRS